MRSALPWGRLSLAALAGVLVLAASIELRARGTDGGEPPRPLPDLDRVLDPLDQPVAWPQALHGRPVLLNMLASWCKPCIDELPDLNRLAADGETDGAFVVLGLNADLRRSDELRNFLEQHQVRFPVWYLPQGGAERDFNLVGYPTSFLLDAEGRIVERVMGPQHWNDGTWARRLRELAPRGGTGGSD